MKGLTLSNETEQEILWTVVQPLPSGEEKLYNFATQIEAIEKLVNLFTKKSGEEAYYGITVIKNDKFIKWTDEQVYIDHELNEFTADEAREYFVGV